MHNVNGNSNVNNHRKKTRVLCVSLSMDTQFFVQVLLRREVKSDEKNENSGGIQMDK